jgi:hypothetical protein
MELVNGVAVPSLVELTEGTVGFAEVLHTTPSAVIGALPLDVTVPPLEALVEVKFVIAVVVTVGAETTSVSTIEVTFKLPEKVSFINVPAVILDAGVITMDPQVPLPIVPVALALVVV